VLTAVEFVDGYKDTLGPHFDTLVHRLHQGVPLGEALVQGNVTRLQRQTLLGAYTAESLAETLDDYYVHVYGKNDHKADDAALRLAATLEDVGIQRRRAQRMGALAFLPFLALLVTHAMRHEIPLFWASFAGFAVAFLALRKAPKMRALALKEAAQEFKEYLFLLPLFLSIALLQKTGFFSEISTLLQRGIATFGAGSVAYGQFWCCTVLSALLDNNVVADFSAKTLQGLDTSLLHLFAMAQIAGYALGGCWTHVGSAQSVVAYAFLQREINPHITPFHWIKNMTWVVLQIALVMTILIYLESWLILKNTYQ
jgi:hypothetical protein